MNHYSVTYAGRIVGFLMALSLMMGWDLDEGYLTEVVTAVLWLSGEALTLYGRYRKGDLHWWGARK